MEKEYYRFVIDMNKKTDEERAWLEKLLDKLNYDFKVEHE